MAEPFTAEQIDDALMALVAWAGQPKPAVEALQAEGKHAPAPTTLAGWARGRYAVRYHELRDKHAEELEAQLAGEYLNASILAADATKLAIGRTMERLERNTDHDPARTAASLAQVADKLTTKRLALTGRPTSIREDRNLGEIVRSLVAKGVLTLQDDEPIGIAAPEESDAADG